MFDQRLARLTFAFLISAFFLLFAGCGSDNDSNAPTTNASVSGTVQGAPGAISGAHLKLYRAGFSGNGTGAKVIASAKSNSSGQFTLRYRAPKDTVLLYIEAAGGDGGAGQNSAIGLMAVGRDVRFASTVGHYQRAVHRRG